MTEIHVLSKFESNPYGGIETDTTSSYGVLRFLSPFILGPIDTYDPQVPQSKNFENLWQYSKVYRCHTEPVNDNPILLWYKWRNEGWLNPKAVRYPMGKGAIPLYSYWDGEKLGYIEARKRLYARLYSEYVQKTTSFDSLKNLYEVVDCLVLRDYDAYDHIKLDMSLKDVINYRGKKCGHAFVLAMILTGVLEECLD